MLVGINDIIKYDPGLADDCSKCLVPPDTSCQEACIRLGKSSRREFVDGWCSNPGSTDVKNCCVCLKPGENPPTPEEFKQILASQIDALKQKQAAVGIAASPLVAVPEAPVADTSASAFVVQAAPVKHTTGILSNKVLIPVAAGILLLSFLRLRRQ